VLPQKRIAGLAVESLSSCCYRSAQVVRTVKSRDSSGDLPDGFRYPVTAALPGPMSEQEEDMRFEILGSMRVIVRSRDLAVRAGRDRTLLAMLILHANHTVPVASLVDALWAESPPRDARGQLQGCVSRLRKQFAGVGSPVINTEPDGYRLLADGATVDVLEFRGLANQARVAANAGRRDEARDRYRTALALWRGPALACIDRGTVREAAAGLDEERAQVLEECIDLELALGGAGELVSELTELVRQHPYRERLHGALMLALYRADRQAEALAAYQRIRRTLVAELGQEPGLVLRELHQRILTGDEALRPVGEDDAPSARSNHLPRTLNDFTGRDAELAWLVETASLADPYGSLVIAIDGMPGVGKTSLAVRAAHVLKSRYPDGQLFIDLQGHSEHRPLDAAAALHTLLRQLGIPTARIAADLDERIAQWRAELAGRQALIVLDNAGTSSQVNQLLPAASGCFTLVTSRRRLVDLDGARPRSVDTLKPSDAVALLERVVGHRVRDEPDATADVAKRCGYLPLALRLAAARIAHRPAWRVRDLADRLSNRHTPLTELSTGDRTVADAFALSYAHLPPDCQRLFRLLGLHSGEHFDAYHAATLVDTSLTSAQRLLDELVDCHLIEEPRPDRYRLHDLVKAFASELVIATEPDAARHAAVERILDYYVHAAAAACSHLDTPDRRGSFQLGEPKRSDLLEKHRDWGMDWLEIERPNLIAGIHHASRHGHHRYAWQIAAATWRFFYLRGYLDDLVLTHRHGLAAAEHLQDAEATATMHNYLASAYYLNGHCHMAIAHLRQALGQRQRIGDRHGTLSARRNLALVYSVSGFHREAAGECQRALAEASASGDPVALAMAVVNAGELYQTLGQYSTALAYSRRGLALRRDVRLERGVATALGNIGRSRARLGELQPAVRLLNAAIRARRRTRNRWGEAEALNELGAVHRLLGNLERALANHREALVVIRGAGLRQEECAIYNELGRTMFALGDRSAALDMQRRALVGTTKIQHKYGQARALDGIAACLRETDPASACQHWLQALELYRELEVPERHEVERQLAALPAHATGG
jgi:DNA-binding SARP family transcriptional activator